MRLIDADTLEEGKFHSIEDWTPVEKASWQWGWNDAIDAIMDSAPTVDAVEVVRCKDCVFCERYNDVYIDLWYLPKRDELLCTLPVVNYPTTDENDFCSRGERREDGRGGR